MNKNQRSKERTIAWTNHWAKDRYLPRMHSKANGSSSSGKRSFPPSTESATTEFERGFIFTCTGDFCLYS